MSSSIYQTFSLIPQDPANVPCLAILGEEGPEKTGGEEIVEKARTSLELFLQVH